VPVAEFHTESAFYNQKHLVFVLVMMKDEFAQEILANLSAMLTLCVMPRLQCFRSSVSE
jgi:hypothetical protein